MRLFFLILMSFVITLPVFAQQLIEPETSPNAEEEIEKLLGKQKQKKQAPQTLDNYVYEYTQRCLKAQHPIFAGKDLENFCFCAQKNIPTAMTLEHIKDAQYKTSEGYFQRNRMLMFVYAPCIEAPLKKMVLNSCLNNVRSKHLMKNMYATCGCIADDVSKHLQGLTTQYIQGAVERKKDTLNPLDLLLVPDHFERTMSHKTKVCFSRHERRY